VAEAEHHRVVHRCETPLVLPVGAARAAELPLDALPARHRQRLAPERQDVRERSIAIHDKRSAVEDELVLATDLIDVHQRQARLRRAKTRELEALAELLDLEGRAIGHEQQLRALARQLDRTTVEPDVL